MSQLRSSSSRTNCLSAAASIAAFSSSEFAKACSSCIEVYYRGWRCIPSVRCKAEAEETPTRDSLENERHDSKTPSHASLTRETHNFVSNVARNPSTSLLSVVAQSRRHRDLRRFITREPTTAAILHPFGLPFSTHDPRLRLWFLCKHVSTSL